MSLYRDSQKRFYNAELTYVVTVNVDGKIPFFKEQIFCELWIEELRLCKNLKQFELYGFCLNYDHFHMVVNPCKEFNISKVMHSLKRNFSRDANKIIFSSVKDVIKKSEGEDPHLRHSFCSSEVGEPRLQKIDIVKYREQLIRKYGKNHKLPKFKWQQSFHDHFIRGDQDFENQSNYVIYNFLKHSLPRDWKYTALNFPELLNNT